MSILYLFKTFRTEFDFYKLRTLKDGKPVSVGTEMALAGKGEFRAIEMVIGVNLDGKIRAAYIQSSREKVNNALRYNAFLNQFIEKSARDPLEFGKDLKGLDETPIATEIVCMTIKKMLIFYCKELAGA